MVISNGILDYKITLSSIFWVSQGPFWWSTIAIKYKPTWYSHSIWLLVTKYLRVIFTLLVRTLLLLYTTYCHRMINTCTFHFYLRVCLYFLFLWHTPKYFNTTISYPFFAHDISFPNSLNYWKQQKTCASPSFNL